MSNPSVVNIEHSGARLYLAPVGEANPDETSIALDAAWGGNWVRVGYTKAPWTQAYTSDEADILVEEEIGPVKRRRVGETLVWETTLAEIAAEYVRLAGSEQDSISTTAAAGGQKGYEETGIGGETILAEKKWGVEMMHVQSDGTEQPIRIFMHKGTATFNGNLEFSKKATEPAGIPVQIKALTDTTQSEGQKFVMFQRVTASAT